MHDDTLTFQDGRLKLSVDADGMTMVQTVTRIPLNHLRQVIVGVYSTFTRSQLESGQGEVCEITNNECED